MQVPSWLKWLGLVVAIAGVVASPAFADLVPQVVANVFLVGGAIAAALSRGITNGTALTWTGLLVTALAVFAEPTVAGALSALVGAATAAKVAQAAALIGALLAAVGGAIPKTDR